MGKQFGGIRDHLYLFYFGGLLGDNLCSRSKLLGFDYRLRFLAVLLGRGEGLLENGLLLLEVVDDLAGVECGVAVVFDGGFPEWGEWGLEGLAGCYHFKFI